MNKKIIGNTVGTPANPQAMIEKTEQAEQIRQNIEHTEDSTIHVTPEEKQAWGNKLEPSELPEIINAALTQAKDSGEFDGKDGYTPVKGVDYFDGKDGVDGEDATIKVGTLGNLVEVPELNIINVTQEEYENLYESGNIDPNAVYVTPEGEYAPLHHTHSASEVGARPNTWVPTASEVGARPNTWTPTASEVGADESGTAESKVSSHNTSATAHNDIRLLISEITTKLTNFLDVDDTTVDQLSEVLTLINNNKGTLESLTTNKVNVSAIVDNLTTSDPTKVLSAKQGVAIKALIDALKTAVNNIKVPTKTSELTNDSGFLTQHQDISGKVNVSDLTAHTGDTSNPHGVTPAQIGAAKLQSPNNMIHNGNEFTFIPAGYNGVVHINDKTADSSQGNVSTYYLHDGKGGLSELILGNLIADAIQIYGDFKAGLLKTDNSEASIKISDNNELNFGTVGNTLYIGYENRTGSSGYVNTYCFGAHTGGDRSESGTIKCGAVVEGGTALSEKYVAKSQAETWTFTLEDGSTVDKVVYVG